MRRLLRSVPLAVLVLAAPLDAAGGRGRKTAAPSARATTPAAGPRAARPQGPAAGWTLGSSRTAARATPTPTVPDRTAGWRRAVIEVYPANDGSIDVSAQAIARPTAAHTRIVVVNRGERPVTLAQDTSHRQAPHTLVLAPGKRVSLRYWLHERQGEIVIGAPGADNARLSGVTVRLLDPPAR